MVVWFYTSFGYTEIKFGSFLQKILPESTIIRRLGFYSKGAKPTIGQTKSGISGITLVKNAIIDMEMAMNDLRATKPDMVIFSDDTDCKISFDQRQYIYHDQQYEIELNKLIKQCRKMSPEAKIIFLFASSEIETWFLADSANTFEKTYAHINPFAHQLNTFCSQKIFPLNRLESFSKYNTQSSSCEIKISEHCIQEFIKRFPDSDKQKSNYSKRIEGQKFIEILTPSNLTSLTDFFKPAYDAILANRDFIPITP